MNDPITVWIEGQEYPAQVTMHAPRVEYVRSYSATKPDPAWRYVDPAGHEHRWRDASLPTLHQVHARVRCDGTCGDPGCEGGVRALYACRTCAAWVRPGWVPDYAARTTGTPVPVSPGMVEIEVEGMWPNERREGLRVVLFDRSLVGTMTEWSIESGVDGWTRPRFTVCAPLPDPS